MCFVQEEKFGYMTLTQKLVSGLMGFLCQNDLVHLTLILHCAVNYLEFKEKHFKNCSCTSNLSRSREASAAEATAETS